MGTVVTVTEKGKGDPSCSKHRPQLMADASSCSPRTCPPPPWPSPQAARGIPLKLSWAPPLLNPPTPHKAPWAPPITSLTSGSPLLAVPASSWTICDHTDRVPAQGLCTCCPSSGPPCSCLTSLGLQHPQPTWLTASHGATGAAMVLAGIHPGKEKLREGVMDQKHTNVLVGIWLLAPSCPLLSTSCPPAPRTLPSPRPCQGGQTGQGGAGHGYGL